MDKKIRVLVVDDSAVVRKTLADILESDPQIRVIATACDPYVASDRIRKEVPDVITLDLEMPRMDGLTFLRSLMSQRPIPVVICSSFSEAGSRAALRALEYGAAEIIQKPRVGTKRFLEESSVVICDAVKAAFLAGVKKVPPSHLVITPKLTADAVIPKPLRPRPVQDTERVVVVGASTGGTEAILTFLQCLPEDSPGVVVVQHMPEHFTAAFARRLDGICRVSVKEASDGDTVSRGLVLIAPGNLHTMLKRVGGRYYVEVKDGPLVCRHRPSVDVLFRSAARYAGKNAVGVIMTGMGDDGARGMLEMKEAGAATVAQDKASCVVYGMPYEAVKKGGVQKELPLELIGREILRLCEQPASQGAACQAF